MTPAAPATNTRMMAPFLAFTAFAISDKRPPAAVTPLAIAHPERAYPFRPPPPRPEGGRWTIDRTLWWSTVHRPPTREPGPRRRQSLLMTSASVATPSA